jgi:magnesium-protoporphyrin O-methyltransferase
MDCCQCQGIEAKFNEAYVAKKLEAYRKDGPKKTTLALIQALQIDDLSDTILLDIGGGVGDIQHALLKLGARPAMAVEASPAYLAACRREAERQGHADRIQSFRGNFVDLAGEIPDADVVTLDRVICCYHDMQQLVSLSAQKAKRMYGVVYPRDTWWVKLGNELYYNLRHWLRGYPMRNFIHSTRAVEAVLEAQGLRRRFQREMGGWQVAVFARP